MAAFAQDILTRIVNVQWGGLAVIFGKEAEDAPKPGKPSVTGVFIELPGDEIRADS